MLNDGSERIGRITLDNGYGVGYYLVYFKGGLFARNIHRHYLTPLDPNLTPLLNATQGEE